MGTFGVFPLVFIIPGFWGDCNGFSPPANAGRRVGEAHLQLVADRKAHGGAQGHAVDRIGRDVDVHLQFLAEVFGQAVQLRAAAGQHDAVLVDIAGQLGGRLFQHLVGRGADLLGALKYDTNVLTPVSIEAGPGCPSDWMVTIPEDLTNGKFAAVSPFNTLSLNGTTIDGVIAQYTFKVKEDAALGESVLELVVGPEDTYITSSEGTAVDFTPVNGSVNVISGNTGNSDNSNSNNTTTGSDSGNESDKNPSTGNTDTWALWLPMILIGGIVVTIAIAKKQKA